MKRKPTTNPQINGVPMSFMRLGSAFQTPLRLIVPNPKTGEPERVYTQDSNGTVRRVVAKG